VRACPSAGRSAESHAGGDSGHLPCARGDKGKRLDDCGGVFDPESREPSAAIAQAIQQKALAQGLLLLICGQYGNVIRFLYPLTIPDAQFNQALAILQQVMRDKS
jgi:4-aminobutyrate aminotransferase